MKNNRDKLHGAFGGLRGDTLREAMEAMEAPALKKRISPRRFLALTAACLAAVMVVGAVVAVPMMTAEGPALPDAVGNDTLMSDVGNNDTFLPNTGVTMETPEENYPFVRVRALSALTEGGEEATDDNVSVNLQYSRIMLTFDLQEGETAEITSHYTLNRQTALSQRLEELILEYDRMEMTESMIKTLERILYRELRHLESEAETELVEWEPNRVLIQISDNSFLVSKRFFSILDLSDAVDFVIRNEAGEIVGAGSVCFAIKQLYSSDMIRHEILGSKRFDTPVTEEEAAAYVDGLHESMDAVIADMDFTPATADEGYEVAKADIVRTCYSNGQVIFSLESAWTEYSDLWEFRFLRARGRAQDEERFFIMLPDGTWGEISEDSGWINETCTEEGCVFGEGVHEHHVGRNLVLTDGRTVSVERQIYLDENGQAMEKYVPVFAPEAESV